MTKPECGRRNLKTRIEITQHTFAALFIGGPGVADLGLRGRSRRSWIYRNDNDRPLKLGPGDTIVCGAILDPRQHLTRTGGIPDLLRILGQGARYLKCCTSCSHETSGAAYR